MWWNNSGSQGAPDDDRGLDFGFHVVGFGLFDPGNKQKQH